MPKQPVVKKRLGTPSKVRKSETLPVTLVGTAYANLIPEGEDGIKVIEAMTAYMSTGSMTKVSQLTGATGTEMSGWMSAPWWDETLAVLRQKQQDALDGRISGLIDLSLDTVDERLRNGDPQWIKDEGLVNVPVKAGVAAKIMHTLYEKRALIRGDSTSNVRREEGGLAKLAKLLESISKEKKTERVIPGERLE